MQKIFEDLNGVFILHKNRRRWFVILEMYRKPLHPSSQFHEILIKKNQILEPSADSRQILLLFVGAYT